MTKYIRGPAVPLSQASHLSHSDGFNAGACFRFSFRGDGREVDAFPISVGLWLFPTIGSGCSQLHFVLEGERLRWTSIDAYGHAGLDRLAATLIVDAQTERTQRA